MVESCPNGRIGRVTIGLVAERRVVRDGSEPPAQRWDLMAPRDRVAKAVGLRGELHRTRGDREQGTQEVLGSGVLVEPASQVRDAGVDLIVLHHGRVQHQRACQLADGTALGRRHSLQHLQFDPRSLVDRQTTSGHQCPGNIEQVVTGDSDTDRPAPLGAKRGLEHQLVARIDIGLRRIWRGDPIMQFGLDRLHRQVGALDDPDLDAGAPAVPAPRCPLAEVLQHSVTVGQVRLQHDAGFEMVELRFVEHPRERDDRQLQIAVLLHVEVDEPTWLLHRRGAIDLAQWLADSIDAAIEVEHVEVGDERRGLDRDGAHVGALQLAQHLVDSSSRFVVAEDRFAEWIDQQANPISPPLRGVLGELRILGRQHHPLGLAENSPAHERHDNVRDVRRKLRTGAHHQPIESAERRRQTVLGHHVREAARRSPVGRNPQDLVCQALHQFAAGGVCHQASEAMQLAPLTAGRVGLCLEKQGVGERDGFLDSYRDVR